MNIGGTAAKTCSTFIEQLPKGRSLLLGFEAKRSLGDKKKSMKH